jgi:uncharacterized protein
MSAVPETCWLHPGLTVRPSPIDGDGLFADEPIASGDVVARLGGTVLSLTSLSALFAARAEDPSAPYVDTIALAEGFHLVLPPGQPIHFGNHSCDPNVWWVDALTLTSRRDIRAGEEVTNDYGSSSGVPGFEMACRCGSMLCRGVVTGSDWQREDLRACYRGHWVPELQRRIDDASPDDKAGF